VTPRTEATPSMEAFIADIIAASEGFPDEPEEFMGFSTLRVKPIRSNQDSAATLFSLGSVHVSTCSIASRAMSVMVAILLFILEVRFRLRLASSSWGCVMKVVVWFFPAIILSIEYFKDGVKTFLFLIRIDVVM